jgi:predicted tellurium resistance membrane protein TerC
MAISSISHIVFSLLTLTFLEIVLGIDNLVFLTIASTKLPKHKQKRARQLGLLFALVTRLLLLASIVWLAHLNQPLMKLGTFNLSIRDILLLVGGLFLLYKATWEIHAELEVRENKSSKKISQSMMLVILQIGIFDIIFSLDSVFTAIGLTDSYWIMATAIFIAILTMIFLSEPLSQLISHYPTIKMLALSFLILIGTLLVADGLHFHVPREYIYFAICFSIFVEILNTIAKRKR